MSPILVATFALVAGLSTITGVLYAVLPMPAAWAGMLVAPVSAIAASFGLIEPRREGATVRLSSPARRAETRYPRSMNG